MSGSNGRGSVIYNVVESERCVIGVVLAEPSVIGIARCLSPADFYEPKHEIIWQSICDAISRDGKFDAVSIAEDLTARGSLASVGGLSYLMDLVDYYGICGAPEVHVRRVLFASLRRSLTSRLTAAASALMTATGPVDEIATDIDREISEIMSRAAASRPAAATLRDAAADAVARINSCRERGGVVGPQTGIGPLDALMRGLAPGEFSVVCARPGCGKTAFLVNIALGVAERTGVLFSSIEMGRAQLALRAISARARTPLRSEMTTSGGESSVAATAAATVSDLPIWIDDSPRQTVDGIDACRRFVSSNAGAIGVVLVDYLQIVSPSRRAESRRIEVGEIARGLKKMARSEAIHVVAASQINREGAARSRLSQSPPDLDTISEADAIGHEADNVIFLSPQKSMPVGASTGRIVRVTLAKHRNGPTGTFLLRFLPDQQRFVVVDVVDDDDDDDPGWF